MPKIVIPDDHELDPERLDKLTRAIEAFLPFAKENRWNTRYGAYDACDEASDCFLHKLHEFEIDGIIEYYDFAGRCCTFDQMVLDVNEYPIFVDTDRYDNHWAVRVGNVIIDWTARQFDRAADFPAIWTSVKRSWRNCEA